MNKQKIIIVEDDEITSLNLNLSLQKQGYTVIAVCDNVEQALNKIRTFNPDLIIVDISLDKKDDGIELGKIIREKYNIPFVYLTSHSDNDIIHKAKLTEPYGYIVKPFDPASLHATMQIALFKFGLENEKQNDIQTLKIDKLNLDKMLYSKCSFDKSIIYFGEKYHFDITICETFYDNKKIKLTKKENAFLRLLIAKLGAVVSFKMAINYVWEDHGATENSVRTLVWRLRNKLPTNIINNASGIGYCVEE